MGGSPAHETLSVVHPPLSTWYGLSCTVLGVLKQTMLNKPSSGGATHDWINQPAVRKGGSPLWMKTGSVGPRKAPSPHIPSHLSLLGDPVFWGATLPNNETGLYFLGAEGRRRRKRDKPRTSSGTVGFHRPHNIGSHCGSFVFILFF